MEGKTPGQSSVSAEPLKKGLFDRVAGYQQAVLLLAGFAYAFGYLSRALHAWEKNLGALPGVRFEYLVAGTILLIPPVAFCLAIWGVWRSAKWLAAWAANGPQRKTRIQNALTGGMLLGFGTLFFRQPVNIIGIFFAAGCFLYLVIYFAAADKLPSTSGTPTEADKLASTSDTPTEADKLPSTSDTPTEADKLPSTSNTPTGSSSVGRWQKVLIWLGRTAGCVWTVVVALWVGLLLLMVFVLAVGYGGIALSYVPQELGGIKPKCGVFDLAPEQLSPELRALIVSPGQHLDSSSKVVRSMPLEVFTTSEPWLVRLPRAAVGVPPRSIRLDGKVVLSVEWCR